MVNPLEFFQVGQQIGQARSPVGGIGQMIRGVLEKAYQSNLVQGQYSNALTLAQQKADLKAQQDSAPEPYGYVDKNAKDAKGNIVPKMVDLGNFPGNYHVTNMGADNAGYIEKPSNQNAEVDQEAVDMKTITDWIASQQTQ